MANRVFVDIVFRRDKKSTLVSETKKQASKGGTVAGKSFGKNFTKASNKEIKSTGGLLKGLTAQVASMALGFVAFRAITSSIAEAFQATRDFSRGIAEINTILPKNQKLTKDSISAINQMAGAYGSTAQQQAKGFYAIVSAGVRGTAKQLETLAVANKTAVAGLVDIETASRALVSSVNAYATAGLTAKDASDKLFIAVREGQTTFGELADFLGNTSAIASSVGVSFGELTGAVSALTKGGLDTSKATIALRSVLTSLVKPSDDARKTAKGLGLEFSSTALRAKGLAGFLKDVSDKTRGNTDALGKLFGNVRGLSGVLKIVNGDFADFERIIGETTKKSDAGNEAFKEMQKSLDFKLKSLSSEFKAFGVEVLTTAEGPMKTFVAGLRTIFELMSFKIKDKSPVDLINEQMSETAKHINTVRERLSEPFLIKVQSLVSGKDVRAILEGELAELMATRKKQLAIRTAMLDDSLSIKRAEAKALVEAEQKMLQEIGASQVGAKLKADQLGIKTIESLKTLQAEKLQVIKEALDAEKQLQFFNDDISDEQRKEMQLASEREYQERRLQIIGASMAEQASLTENLRLQQITVADGIKGAWDGLSIGFDTSAKTMQKTALGTASIIKGAFAKGISGGIQNVVNSLAKGEDVFANFGKFVIGMFADLAIQLGEFWIAQGIAIEAANASSGSGGIVAGMALVAVGSIMKAFAGGGGASASPATGGSGSISSSFATDAGPDIDEPEIQEKKTAIALTIEGNVFNNDETKSSILDFLNEQINESGGTINNASFA